MTFKRIMVGAIDRHFRKHHSTTLRVRAKSQFLQLPPTCSFIRTISAYLYVIMWYVLPTGYVLNYTNCWYCCMISSMKLMLIILYQSEITILICLICRSFFQCLCVMSPWHIDSIKRICCSTVYVTSFCILCVVFLCAIKHSHRKVGNYAAFTFQRTRPFLSYEHAHFFLRTRPFFFAHSYRYSEMCI